MRHLAAAAATLGLACVASDLGETLDDDGAGSTSTGEASGSSSGPDPTLGDPPPADPPPALVPTLRLVTYVGGAGNQYLRDIEVAADDSFVVAGTGFTVHVSADGTSATIEGDVAVDDLSPYADGPALVEAWNTEWDPEVHARELEDPRNGQTYWIGTKRVHPELAQPLLFSSAGWTLWDWSADSCFGAELTAQAHGYDVWLMPGDEIGVLAWTADIASTLGRDPVRSMGDDPAITLARTLVDVGISAEAWQPMPEGSGAMIMVIDPATGLPSRATFVAGVPPTWRAVDPWGRVYLPVAVDRAYPPATPTNPFGHVDAARTGLFVLDPDLGDATVDVRLGGTCEGAGAQQAFGALTLHGDLLIMAGTTCAVDVPTTAGAPQPAAGDAVGGGQDGLLVVIDLWE